MPSPLPPASEILARRRQVYRECATYEDTAEVIDGPLASYATHGHGLRRIALKAARTPVGMCGLLKRDALADVDLGYAFLPAQRGLGLALEAAAAVIRHARETLGLARVIALTAPGNARSEALLAKLGFRFERLVRLEPDGTECRMLASDPAR